MAAPATPPIRLGLTGTGLAVEKPHRPALRGLADRCVVARIRLHRGDIARVHGAVRPVGGVARGVANAMVVQRALGSSERAAVLALDTVPGAGPVPLWRPRSSTGLFDGLPGQRISSSASFTT
jgi:hypothetical protein